MQCVIKPNIELCDRLRSVVISCCCELSLLAVAGQYFLLHPLLVDIVAAASATEN